MLLTSPGTAASVDSIPRPVAGPEGPERPIRPEIVGTSFASGEPTGGLYDRQAFGLDNRHRSGLLHAGCCGIAGISEHAETEGSHSQSGRPADHDARGSL